MAWHSVIWVMVGSVASFLCLCADILKLDSVVMQLTCPNLKPCAEDDVKTCRHPSPCSHRFRS